MQAGQALRVFQHQFVQVAVMDVQGLRLPVQGLNHMGMAVSDVGHIVIDVQVFFTPGIIQPDALPFDDMHRFVVEQGCACAQQAVASFQNFCVNCHLVFKNNLWSSFQYLGSE